MNEKSESKGPNWRLLLLVPAAAILFKGATRRRARWASTWGAPGAAARGHSHGGRFGATETGPDGRSAFRLPPKIEWMLDSWHTRAHEAVESTENPTI